MWQTPATGRSCAPQAGSVPMPSRLLGSIAYGAPYQESEAAASCFMSSEPSGYFSFSDIAALPRCPAYESDSQCTRGDLGAIDEMCPSASQSESSKWALENYWLSVKGESRFAAIVEEDARLTMEENPSKPEKNQARNAARKATRKIREEAQRERLNDDKLHSLYGPVDIKLQKAILKLDDSRVAQLDELTQWSTRTLSINVLAQTLKKYLESRPHVYKLYTVDSELCVCLAQERIYTFSEFADRHRASLTGVA